MQMLINGMDSTLSDYEADDLARSVVNSLFSWRRATRDEVGEGESRMGWWGDTFDDDPIGSKLWLLLREKLTPETLIKAREYCEEALQWLIEDEVATDVRVNVSRFSLDGIAIDVEIIRTNRQKLSLRFRDVWERNK